MKTFSTPTKGLWSYLKVERQKISKLSGTNSVLSCFCDWTWFVSQEVNISATARNSERQVQPSINSTPLTRVTSPQSITRSCSLHERLLHHCALEQTFVLILIAAFTRALQYCGSCWNITPPTHIKVVPESCKQVLLGSFYFLCLCFARKQTHSNSFIFIFAIRSEHRASSTDARSGTNDAHWSVAVTSYGVVVMSVVSWPFCSCFSSKKNHIRRCSWLHHMQTYSQKYSLKTWIQNVQ